MFKRFAALPLFFLAACSGHKDVLSDAQHQRIAQMADSYKGEIRYGASFEALNPSAIAASGFENTKFNPKDDFSGLVRDNGYEETFYNCSSCHSMQIVMTQNLDKKGWEAKIDLMISRGMYPPEKNTREKITSYLAKNFGLDNPKGQTAIVAK